MGDSANTTSSSGFVGAARPWLAAALIAIAAISSALAGEQGGGGREDPIPDQSWKTRQVTFSLYTGIPKQKVYLAANFAQWEHEGYPLAETGPGYYALTLPEPWTDVVQYKFVVNGQWMLDPSNSEQVSDGYGSYNSVYRTRFREDPLLSKSSQTPAWLEKTLFVEDWEGANREIIVLYPPKFPADKPVSVIYFQDGRDYLEKASVRNLIPNLATREDMPAYVAVFVPPKDRRREYALTASSDFYVKFLAQTVVPAVERDYLGKRLTLSISDRLLIGPSLGGLITIYAGLRHPTVFPWIASQSGSFWYEDGKIVKLLEQLASQDLKLFFEVGIYETDAMVEHNRAAYLKAKRLGLDVFYQEFPSAHDWRAWRNRLSRILAHFHQFR